MEELDDQIMVIEKALEVMREIKEFHKKNSEKLAGLIDEVKTSAGKELVMQISNASYKSIIEMEIEIGKNEVALGNFKTIREMMS